LKEWNPIEVEFYKKKYISASKGNYDIYVVFVERGLELLNEKGLLGYILPHKFFNAKYGQSLRSLITDGKNLDKIVHFGDQQIFENATTYTTLLFLNKTSNKSFEFEKIDSLNKWRKSGESIRGKIDLKKLSDTEWNFMVGKEAELFEKLNKNTMKLTDVTERIFQGLKTGADKIFIVKKVKENSNLIKIHSNQNELEYWIEPNLLHPLIKGGDSKQYILTMTDRYIIFPYMTTKQFSIEIISQSVLNTNYPKTWQYLLDHKKYLESRENGKMKGSNWFAYSRNQALNVISTSKIFTPDLAMRASFSLDKEGKIFFTGGAAGGYGILVKSNYSREYILGLLNSTLLDWFEHKRATTFRGGYFSYESRFIKDLPIRNIDFDNPKDVEIHDKMVELVDKMLKLHENLVDTKVPIGKERIQRQIDATDKQIDTLVYELYGITDEEIGIVNGSFN